MLYNVYRQASVSIFCWCCLWFWLTLGFCRPDILNEFLTFWRRTVWPRIVGWSLNSDPWHRYQMKAYTPSKTPLTEMQTKAGFPNNEISFRAGVFTTLQFHFCEGSVFVLIEKDTFETFNHFEEFQDFGKNALYQASLYSTWVLTLLCLYRLNQHRTLIRRSAPALHLKTCQKHVMNAFPVLRFWTPHTIQVRQPSSRHFFWHRRKMLRNMFHVLWITGRSFAQL